jgi:hypothetical protein
MFSQIALSLVLLKNGGDNVTFKTLLKRKTTTEVAALNVFTTE